VILISPPRSIRASIENSATIASDPPITARILSAPDAAASASTRSSAIRSSGSVERSPTF
jgi:hypothetical protein